MKSKTPVTSNAFSAAAQSYLFDLYGDPRTPGWQQRWMTLWNVQKEFPWFPKEKMYLHKDFQKILHGAFAALERAGVHTEIKSCAGTFNIRAVRGSYSVLSTHSWGAAIDLNAQDNPMGSEGKWSPKFLLTMVENKVFCGQLWIGRKDPMHFAMVNG
jgi:hypothetical protein